MSEFERRETGISVKRAKTGDIVDHRYRDEVLLSESQYKGAVSSSGLKTKESASAASNSFWVPSKTPDSGKHILTKPDGVTRCPATRVPLKLKDLFPLKVTTVKEVGASEDTEKLGGKSFRFACPCCKKTLTNAVKAIAIKSTGHVYCSNCIDLVVKPDKTCLVCA